ncbi:MAG: ArnT family glycosyltransferase [Bacteriovoracaceae bacterium]
MTKNLKIGLFVLFIIQILVAANFELANDEAYYWLYSKHLDWGYFDHPPFVAWTIALFSFLPKSELSVRLGFIVLQFLSLLLILKMISERASYNKAALLFFAFPLASFSGLLALPDMPLLFMATCYCYSLKRFLESEDTTSVLMLIFSIPLLLYAKYHGILFIFFTILANPKLLLNKKFYFIALISIILFLPHVLWQYQHDFPSIRYHFLERPAASFSIKRSLEYLLTQVGLAGALTGPIVWWITIKEKSNDQFLKTLKFISIGTLIFFLVSSFSKKVEANWTIALTSTLILLSIGHDLWNKKWSKVLLVTSFILIFSARFLLVFPEGFKIKRLKEFYGWKDWAQMTVQECGGRPVVANTYQIASKLSYYLNKDIPALNIHSRKNQFDIWNFGVDQPSKEVCYLTDKAEFEGKKIPTPDGKNLKLVLNKSMVELIHVKKSESSKFL